MTVRQFGAPAPFTRPTSPARDDARRPIVRIAWLVARCVRREPVLFEHYVQRFGQPFSAFRRDVAALRRARIYRGAQLLGRDCSTDAERYAERPAPRVPQ